MIRLSALIPISIPFVILQDALRESPNHSTQSPEITSKALITDDEAKESVKRLTEKLSAALVNVSAKEELVKQHAKVAEEAVAGNHLPTVFSYFLASSLFASSMK